MKTTHIYNVQYFKYPWNHYHNLDIHTSRSFFMIFIRIIKKSFFIRIISFSIPYLFFSTENCHYRLVFIY